MGFCWAAAASLTPVDAVSTEMHCRETGNETGEHWLACLEFSSIASLTAVTTTVTAVPNDALSEHKKVTRAYGMNDCMLSASGSKSKVFEAFRSAFKLLFYSFFQRRGQVFKLVSGIPYVEWPAAFESYTRSSSLIFCLFKMCRQRLCEFLSLKNNRHVVKVTVLEASLNYSSGQAPETSAWVYVPC